ncbi:MAG TPA: tRNA (adenosine(37)-N6)-threonylcarbamoyltransferase complex dimerization subunit type 1 TsaB [Lachnospiraceae bacterium]|nr:tRNA (adenosine(37)-N6)-threonylcarbamoyltransferase complex dimerization subunit type 1 TsaB [Lachnospiraceae bacterium]
MKILGLDSSGLVAATALVSDGILTAEYTIHNKKTHSQTLMPMIAEMLSMAGTEPGELDAVAVSEGPGSFTGLRIGASIAKGLAWTLKIPIIPVSSLMGLAANVETPGQIVCPIMDARRNQVYTAVYETTETLPVQLAEPDVIPIEDALARAEQAGEQIVFLGDGVPVFRTRILEKIGNQCRFVTPTRRYQSAASIALLGQYLYEKEAYVQAEQFAPVYLRKSQAEREREEKNT